LPIYNNLFENLLALQSQPKFIKNAHHPDKKNGRRKINIWVDNIARNANSVSAVFCVENAKPEAGYTRFKNRMQNTAVCANR